MAYAVGLKFDEITETKITDIWRQLSDLGFTTALLLEGYVPHISLVLSDTLKVVSFVEEMGHELQATPNIQIQFSSISFFINPNMVMYYGITPTKSLLALHALSDRIYQKHATKLDPLYRPDSWVPHCALAIGINEEKLKAGIDIARTISIPFSVPSVEYVIVEHDGQRAHTLHSFPL